MTRRVGRLVKARTVGSSWMLSGSDLADAVGVLQSDGLVVYPTETLYGLGANPYSEGAVERMFEVKKKRSRAPVAIAVSGLDEARHIASFAPRDLRIWKAFMPGPLTMILRARSAAPRSVVSGKGSLGLRMPQHDVALTLAREFGPITATSANLHRAPPARTVDEAISQLGNRVDLYIDAGSCPVGQGSTVVDLTSERITIKRKGAVGIEELERHGRGGSGEVQTGR